MAEIKRRKTKDDKAPKRLKLRRTSTKDRKFRIVPGFLRNAWVEIKQVTWPGRKETARLTVAVLIFSIVFGAFVAALDFGLDKVFKEVILR